MISSSHLTLMKEERKSISLKEDSFLSHKVTVVNFPGQLRSRKRKMSDASMRSNSSSSLLSSSSSEDQDIEEHEQHETGYERMERAQRQLEGRRVVTRRTQVRLAASDALLKAIDITQF